MRCLCLLFCCWLWLCQPVLGFVLDDTLINQTPSNLADDLQGAARWSNVPGSVLSGVRGLGEGLEYAIAPEFCAQILPQFQDRSSPSCAQIEADIQKAFDRWGENHPVLRFTSVTPSLRAQLPPPGTPEPWRGFGAEIDLFALSPQAYPQVANFGAYTTFWYVNPWPISLQGQPISGKTLTSADIVFNNQSCYFLDAQQPIAGCNHFESLLIHEIGHALSLDHPNEFPQRNFDTDDIPGNAMAINCQDPSQNLQLVAQVDSKAMMNSSFGAAANPQLQLSLDDMGGRNFLYPFCQTATSTYPSSPEANLWQLWSALLAGSFCCVLGIATIVQQLRKRYRKKKSIR